MDEDRMSTMTEATRLTREGRISEAMTLIQGALSGPGLQTPGSGNGLPVLAMQLPEKVRSMPGRRGPNVLPAGAQFINFQHTGPAGSLTYKHYVPSGYGGGDSVPLVVMLHGGTQDARDFAAGTHMNDLAERDGFLVAYPEQPSSANGMKYWNWFEPGHQVSGAGEPSLIAGITRQIMRGYAVDASRVYVAGFSAGGAMAAVMAATYPDLYAAAGVHSGLPYAAAGDVASAFAAMKQGPSRPARPPARPLPLIVFHGDRDAIVAPANAAGLIDHALAAASPDRRPGTPPAAVTTGQVPGGHAYTRTCYQDPAGAALAER